MSKAHSMSMIKKKKLQAYCCDQVSIIVIDATESRR